MPDGYAFPLGDATHPYPNNGDALRRTDSVAWTANTNGTVRAGKRPGSGFGLSIVTGPERVRVTPGRAIVVHSQNGHYRTALVNIVDVALTSRPSSGTSRIDTVILRVYDAGADTTTNLVDARVEVVAGQPSATPSASTSIPDGSLVLGTLTVPAPGSDIGVTERCVRTVPAGGTVPVFDQADRDTLALFKGLRVFREDLGLEQTNRDGTANGWRTVAAPSQSTTGTASLSATTSPVVAASLTLPAGTWVLQAKGGWDWSTSSLRQFTMDLFNATANTVLDQARHTTPGTSGRTPSSCLAVVTLTAQTTITVRGTQNATGGSTNLIDVVLVATPDS